MLIRPELQALRGDDTPQRLAQSRLAKATGLWREQSGAALAEAELVQFAAGFALEDLPFLAALFAPVSNAATEFVAGLVAVQVAELSNQPFGQVIWRHFTDDVLASLVLARHGTATLTLQAFDGRALAAKPAPESANFSPGETWDRILAGSAHAELVRIESEGQRSAELSREDLQLRPGMVTHRHCVREAQLFRKVTGSLVALKLQRRAGQGAVARQYRLADGALLHQAAGTPRESRLELTAALLGRMGRIDAAPMLAAMAEEEASAALRWQALRECLALDSATGFASLCQIAAHPGDPLAAPAGALRAQLLESYPQLAACQNGVSPCPV